MAVLFSNNASTTLAAGITSGATTLTVAAGNGALFPAITSPDFFYATLINSSNQIEIVKVTARSTDTFTITRGQEGTTARAYSTGDKVELRVTAAGLGNKLDKDTGGTLSGPLYTPASTSGGSGFRVPHGTAPSSPVNGDLWSTSSGLFARINSATVQFSTAPMVYPSAGIAVSTGSAWGTSLTAPTSSLVGTDDGQTLTNKTLSGSTLYASVAISDTGTISVTSPGFRGVPQNSQTGSYTLALTDAGKHISITTGGVTVPANSSVAFPIGTAITIYNDSSSNQTLAITSDTLRWAGSTNTGSRTLGAYALATVVKVKATEWVVSGAGVS